jgi:hypothetical protein
MGMPNQLIVKSNMPESKGVKSGRREMDMRNFTNNSKDNQRIP